MSIYRGAGGSGDAVADSSSEALLVRELAIEVQADADSAAASASAATSSASAAATSATNAASSATSAASSATSASTSATNAASSATNAASSATGAETAQAAAETAQAAAETAQVAAETAETNAETAATNAASSASAASTSATNASNSATSAATSATNASNSASAAATSATNATSSATSASGSATAAASSASSASTSASNAATSETNAATSASTATTQAGLAATSASNAATSETNAASSASAASTSASNAATSETNAASSASTASSAASAALASLDSFDDRYLGAKSSEPTLDNDGNALASGALYFNTVSNTMKVYTGSVWVDAYADGATFLAKANNLSDLPSVSTARSNLGLGTAALVADSTLVHTSGNETIGGTKTFSVDASISGLTVGKGGGAVGSNTVVGVNAGLTNSTGAYSTYVGAYAGLYPTNSNNTGIGYGALSGSSGATGANNTAVGSNALQANTTASNNTAVGYQAGYSNTTDGYNTFLGYKAGYASNNTTGNTYSTHVGAEAGLSQTSGYRNAFFGAGSGNLITTGSKNSILGSYSGNQGVLDIRTASNYIVLSDGDGNPRGYFDGNGMFNVINASTGSVKIYASSSTASFTSDHFQSLSFTAAGTGWNHFVGYASIGSTLSVKIQGNGNLQNANNSYGAISDIKLKENIVDASPKLDKLMNVKIRNYNLKGDYEQHKQLGVIAQELETVFPSLVEETADKDIEGNDLGTTTKAVKYSVFVPMLIKAIQELNTKLEAQALEIATLKGQ